MKNVKASFRVPILLLLLVVAGIDQGLKILVLRNLAVGEILYIFGDWFKLRLLFNPGAAFSTGTSVTWLFTTIQLSFVVVAIVISKRLNDPWSAVGLGLIAGGALGNLVDRLTRPPGFFIGHVVDYISVGNFAIFNFADAAITCGVVIFLIGMWVQERQQKELAESSKADIADIEEIK
ncbi:signal peptidase II [Corynebacterium caspium]|uniref:signal peptidase II n=1 Tax=Corynebacterium caspium TaxID=234828 RepID=UPI0024817415|nr:signal peptidase II [Corynebacterium caspium]